MAISLFDDLALTRVITKNCIFIDSSETPNDKATGWSGHETNTALIPYYITLIVFHWLISGV